MAFATYKPGQGKWTRLCSAAGAGVLTLAFVMFLWQELSTVGGQNTVIIQSTVAVIVVLGVGALLWWLLNKPGIVDFMIATEMEMKKVNWPSRKEVIGSTWVVICGTLLMAIVLFGIDFGFAALFQKIGILEGAADAAAAVTSSTP